MANFYGTEKPLLESDVTDRVGVRSVTMLQKWVWKGDSQAPLAEKLAGGPAAPEIRGLGLIGAQTVVRSGFETRWTYEGESFAADGASGLKTRDVSDQYRFDPAFGDTTLLLHRKWEWMKGKFGLTVSKGGEIDWPELAPSARASAGLVGASKDAGKWNPLYGRKTFLSFTGGVWTFAYAERELPAAIYNNVGKIVRRPPGFNGFFGGRNWLVAPPAFSARGTVVGINEKYLLSEDGGWPLEIYDLAEDAG